jgi:hypothetical protein
MSTATATAITMATSGTVKADDDCSKTPDDGEDIDELATVWPTARFVVELTRSMIRRLRMMP